ncbi:hypothetical protein LTR37_015740 [Vermiconidia calcicola]|uniref:Uncharacterized protein n=1 Tax=Vermiconidia calcicola TaxID=1690605 RepID=A0ACC3MPN7_9PEZI|nr:hypothetical protein LTR37_015740 [Vermiconidia calcicola]
MDDFAVSLFYSYFPCLPGMITNAITVDPQSTLSACIRAVGLAAYAKRQNSAHISTEANRYYGSALKKTNSIVASPSDALHDNTLLAIMLLSNFEELLGGGRPSRTARLAHSRGSAAILALRGTEQLATANGRFLLMHASMNLTWDCKHNEHRIPKEVLRLTGEVVDLLDPDDPGSTSWIVHRARLILANLYTDMLNG